MDKWANAFSFCSRFTSTPGTPGDSQLYDLPPLTGTSAEIVVAQEKSFSEREKEYLVMNKLIYLRRIYNGYAQSVIRKTLTGRRFSLPYYWWGPSPCNRKNEHHRYME